MHASVQNKYYLFNCIPLITLKQMVFAHEAALVFSRTACRFLHKLTRFFSLSINTLCSIRSDGMYIRTDGSQGGYFAGFADREQMREAK